jgi:mono/diheme cytochrome c family protein
LTATLVRAALRRRPVHPSVQRTREDSNMPQIHRRNAGLVAGLALLGALGTYAWSALAQAPGRTVRDGVFSAAQMARGKREFDSICANCHEIEELTGPGAYFDEAAGKTVWEVFEYIWAEMPEDEPASLDPNDYAAILAYTLSVYGMPAGADDLPIDRKSLEAIEFAKP